MRWGFFETKGMHVNHQDMTAGEIADFAERIKDVYCRLHESDPKLAEAWMLGLGLYAERRLGRDSGGETERRYDALRTTLRTTNPDAAERLESLMAVLQ